ncbi:elongation factor 1 gamma subunit [Aspergillus ustus]|uniref:Elongation factor 1 gamma subunit n=1 Tax=Aspergillus ustus TaxID=40382 RepID=A0A0C1E280_ASPUT|nr:elongation factor 1 gamma subunit [Aspergillus ustus]
MSFGVLYTRPFNPRSLAILAIAKATNLELEIKTITSSKDAPEEYLRLNPQGKIPTFVGADGVVITEAIAIAVYIASQDETTTLLGSSKLEYAQILRWMSFGITELLPAQGGWFNPLIGRAPFDKTAIEKSKADTLSLLGILDAHLLLQSQGQDRGRERGEYLVGERVSLADLFVVGIVQGPFRLFLDPQWREAHMGVSGWFERVHSLPIVTSVAGRAVLAEVEMPIVPPRGQI